MKKIVFYFLFSFLSFFFFGIKDINTIDELALIYNQKDLEEQNYYKLNFYDFNIFELENVFKNLNIKIITLKPKYGESLEYKNTLSFTENYKEYLMNKGYDKEAASIELNGFKIDSMYILSTKEDLIKLEKRVKIK